MNTPVKMLPPLPVDLCSPATLPPGIDPCEVLFISLLEHIGHKVHARWNYCPDPRRRLQEINEYIQAGEPLPDDLRVFFASAIQVNDLNKGFHIKSSKQQKELKRFIADALTHQRVKASGLPLHRNSGGAFPHVATAYKGEPKTSEAIERQYYNHKKRYSEFCNRHAVKEFCAKYKSMEKAEILLS